MYYQANASEWNSMLLTARAGRGPQWDVASQLYDNRSASKHNRSSTHCCSHPFAGRFQVDQDSHIYYDFTPLMLADGDQDGDQQQQPTPQQQQMSQSQSQVHTPSRHSYASPSPSVRRGDSVYNPGTPNYTGTATPPSMRNDMPPPSTEGRRRITRGSSNRDNNA